MFSDKHKKQGTECGETIKSILNFGLKKSNLNDGESQILPKILFMEPYVSGFVTVFSRNMKSIPIVYNGRDWSNKKSIEFYSNVFKSIGLSDNDIKIYVELIYKEETVKAWDKDGEYSKGAEAAFLFIMASHDKLNAEELQSSIITDARELSQNNLNIENELFGSGGDAASLASSILEVTIIKFVEKFINATH